MIRSLSQPHLPLLWNPNPSQGYARHLALNALPARLLQASGDFQTDQGHILSTWIKIGLQVPGGQRSPAFAFFRAAEALELQRLHVPLVVIGELSASGNKAVREHADAIHQAAVALSQHGAPEDVASRAIVVHKAADIACTGTAISKSGPHVVSRERPVWFS